MESKTLEALISFSDTGISGDFLAAGAVEDEEYLVATQQGVYKAVPQGSEDTRAVLRVAVENGVDTFLLQTAVIDFNRSNKDYRVEITIYDDETVFLAQLTAGDVPDMFYFPGTWLPGMFMDAGVLAAQGYLLDLYTLLDADDALGRDAFVSNILKAAESDDGGLYDLPMGFGVNVISASSSVVGDMSSWNLTECLDFLQTSGFDGYLFGPDRPREWCLRELLALNSELFVNWETGVCRFDSEEFKNLLELVKEYAPAEILESRKNPIVYMQEGEQLLFQQLQFNINYLQIIDGIVGDPVYIGAPCETGSGNTIVYEENFGISATSEYKEAVWDFAKMLFDEKYSDKLFAFPVIQEQMDEYLDYGDDESWTMEQGDMEKDPYAYSIELTNVTGQDRQRMRELIESLDNVYRIDNGLLTIVEENAQEFFAGQKTVDEAASIIQSRVALYLSERLQ